jgi:adenylate kinase
MKIVVAAVPGAGKSTVLQHVKKKMPKIKVVNVGDLIFEIAKKKYKLKDRDEMRKKLSFEQERKLQDKAAEKISKMRGGVILIDTHMCIKMVADGYMPGMPDKISSIIKPDVVIVLEFDPKVVLERRKKDSTRKRDMQTVKEIEEHQEYTKQFALNTAARVEAAFEIIDLKYKQKKPFDHAIKASNEIIKIIKRSIK